MDLFLYGTLRHRPLLDLVAGTSLEAERAILPGHRVVRQEDDILPVLERRHFAEAEGLLLRAVPQEARARLDAYELPFGYAAREVAVTTAEGERAATVYWPGEEVRGTDWLWLLEDWEEADAALTLETAREFDRMMRLNGPRAPLGNFAMMRHRASVRLRARAEAAPATLRHDAGPEDAETLEEGALHGQFFRLSSRTIRHRTFAGAPSEALPREAFFGVDAALVLPFDPAAGTVLVIEQMRMGPLARGSRNPWTLEPVAGIVDAGETPEEAARREAWEEAGLESLDLRPMFDFYPTPGGSTDYFHCFAGLADLSGFDKRRGGLDAEAEDLRAHVLPLERALDLIGTGEINAGPLIAMLYWIERNRAQLVQ